MGQIFFPETIDNQKRIDATTDCINLLRLFIKGFPAWNLEKQKEHFRAILQAAAKFAGSQPADKTTDPILTLFSHSANQCITLLGIDKECGLHLLMLTHSGNYIFHSPIEEDHFFNFCPLDEIAQWLLLSMLQGLKCPQDINVSGTGSA